MTRGPYMPGQLIRFAAPDAEPDDVPDAGRIAAIDDWGCLLVHTVRGETVHVRREDVCRIQDTHSTRPLRGYVDSHARTEIRQVERETVRGAAPDTPAGVRSAPQTPASTPRGTAPKMAGSAEGATAPFAAGAGCATPPQQRGGKRIMGSEIKVSRLCVQCHEPLPADAHPLRLTHAGCEKAYKQRRAAEKYLRQRAAKGKAVVPASKAPASAHVVAAKTASTVAAAPVPAPRAIDIECSLTTLALFGQRVQDALQTVATLGRVAQVIRQDAGVTTGGEAA